MSSHKLTSAITSIKANLKKLDGQTNIDKFFCWTAYIILQNIKSE